MEDADGYWLTYQGDSATEQQLQAMTHEQLAAAVAGANPQALIDRGAALESVAETMDWVGEQIWARAGELEWEGQAAEEFRAWVKEFWRESSALKSYAIFASTAITRAGEALRQAQSEVPPVREVSLSATPEQASQEMFRVGDPLATPLEAEADRQEAVAAIRRLSSVYTLSARTIQDAQEPQFRPLEVNPIDPGVAPPSGSGAGDGSYGPNTPTSPRDTGDPWPAQDSRNGPVQESITAGGGHPSVPPTVRPVQDSVGTSLDSVGTVPNGGAPPVAPPAPAPVVPERSVPGGGVPHQPVTGPLPGWPAPGQPGPGRGGGGGQVPPVRPSGPPAGPGSQPPPVGRPAAPGAPGGQQPPVGRPPMSGGGPGSGPGGGNPWGRANNYGLLGGKPVPNAKPTVASRIPPGGVIQPGMNPTNSRLMPSKNDQQATPRPTYGKATIDGRPTKNSARGRALPKPTGVIGLPGQGRKNKKKKKKNESKDDRQP